MNVLKKILSIGGYVFVIIGVIFKVSHWPFAVILIVVGLVLYFISFLLSFVKNKEDESQTNPEILDDI